MSRDSDALAIVALPTFDVPGAPTSIDARCGRMSLAWPADAPLCCARGAHVDGRAVITLRALGGEIPGLRWSNEGPTLTDRAPSGVVERLADVVEEATIVCAALGDRRGGIRGEGCRIRARDEALLLADCALFPLDLVDGELVVSARIPPDALVPLGARSLWEEARERVAARFGAAVAVAIDEAIEELRARHSHGLRLKTLK